MNIAASNSALVADLPPLDTLQSSSSVNDTAEFVETESAFNRRLLTFELKKNFSRKFTIPQLFFTFIFNSLVRLLEDALKIYKSVRINLLLECEFKNIGGEVPVCLNNLIP